MRGFIGMLNSRIIRNNILYFSRRRLLSSAFECNDAWVSRLNSPLFRNVNIESMYYELINRYRRTKQLNAIDVDIFVTVQDDSSFLIEVEELVHKFRLSPDAHNVLPTTHHAFIRLFLNCNKKNDLVRILNDRLNYGIFPDNYCSIFILNRLLKEDDIRNAAKIAVFPMLQEDFSNSLLNYLSLYSVHKFLMSNETWDNPIPDQEQEEEEDEITIKIPFIRNPYYDEHFDLTSGEHLCGKFLYKISSALENSLSNSYKIMGLALFEKWDQLKEEFVRLKGFSRSESILYRESLEFLENFIKNKSLDDLTANNLTEHIEQIKTECKLLENMFGKLEQRLKEEISTHENTEMLSQEKLYKDWDTLREKKLTEFLNQLKREKLLKDIEKEKEELKSKEELLYFFDNEDEIDLVIERKEELIKKRTFPESTAQQEKDYVPPEVPKKTSTN